MKHLKWSLLFVILTQSLIGNAQTNVYHPYLNGWGASWTVRMQDWQGFRLIKQWTGSVTQS